MIKKDILDRLRKEKGWVVRDLGDKIALNRFYNGKAIEFTLLYHNHKNQYMIQHPRYPYNSVVSHFKSTERDLRLSLNKVCLRAVIMLLKRTGIWALVVNRNFLQVNDNNHRSNKSTVAQELRELIAKSK
jgi:hypothetical protein